MKKIFSLMLVIAVLFAFTPMAAAGQKGASEKAYEHASDMSAFNRVEDWFATVGKSDEEKAQVRAELKAKWAKKKAEKEARKAQKEAEKKAKKVGKETEKTQKKMGKKMKGLKT